jgi:DNA-binding NarL/FixJ family response regulator
MIGAGDLDDIRDLASDSPPSGSRREIGVDGQLLVVMVVAGYPSVRAGLSALLSRQPDFVLADAGGEGSELAPAPAVVVVDAGSIGDEAIEGLSDTYPLARFVFVGGDPTIDGPGVESGAIGYVGPDVDAAALAMAVRGVALGLTVVDPALIAATGLHAPAPPAQAQSIVPGEALTSREREVLELVANGLPNKAIARELGISEHTAKFHVGSLLAKLGAGSRTEAVTVATRRGILSV